jgi:hypothetical protein
LPAELTEDPPPTGVFPEDIVLVVRVPEELISRKPLPAKLLAGDGSLTEVERLPDEGTLLETRSAGQVPQSPLKKPQGLPRRHCQWPAEFVQVRIPTQLGSATGSLEAVSEVEGLGLCVFGT